LCFVSVLCVSFKLVNHGGRQGNMAQALNQWRHPVASREALDVLHQAMPPRITPLHPHGNRNRQRFTCIFLRCRLFVCTKHTLKTMLWPINFNQVRLLFFCFLGCDLFVPTANLQIHRQTFANKFFNYVFIFMNCVFLAPPFVFDCQ
jgi:hypothetical protein